MKVRYLIYLLITFFTLNAVIAQSELGNPYIKNFNSKKHKISATVWDITQDKKGLMHFGTANGLLQFDGDSWRTIKVDNGSTVRSLDCDENGKIYIGAKGEFGYLGEDSLGYPVYISLSKNLPEEHKDFADVWNTYATKDGVFFLTFKKIYQWNNQKFSVFEFDDITAHLGFYVDNQLYLVRQKAGLHVFKNEKFVPVSGGEHYIGKTIFSILPYDNNQVVVATRAHGLEIHNIKTGVISPFQNEVNDELKIQKIYHGAMSENGEYLIGTLNNGIYVISKSGKLLMNINEHNGLQSSNIKYLYKDYYGSIWAGTAMGISLIDLNLPLTFFDAENGIKGYCRDIIRFQDEIYLATGNGIYYLDKNAINPKEKFKPLTNANGQFWQFLIVNNKLYTSSNGLYEIKDKKLYRIHSFGRNALFRMHHSKKNPSLIYLALKNGLALAYVNSLGEVEQVKKFESFSDECHDLIEDKNGNLWLQTAYDYLVKVDASSFEKNSSNFSYKKYKEGEKLAAEEFIYFNDEVLFSSNNGLLKHDDKKGFIDYDKLLFEKLDDEYKVARMVEDHQNNLWLHYHYGSTSGEVLAIKKNDKYELKTNPFTRIKEKISHVKSPYVEPNNIAWFIGGEGVVRYDFNNDLHRQKQYKVNIREVALNSDSIIDFGGNSPKSDFTFNFKNNATSFVFSAATYQNEEEIYYQYFLEGNDEEWSDWTTQNYKEYNYLSEGKYTFKVRAKNVYNIISEEDEFSFEILPPWYRETWAYVIYALLFLAFVFVIIKIATHRLQQSKKQLEKIVEERTKDIVKEKEKVEEQKILLEEVHGELAERNKDVMDSIKYAQHIQSAILPPREKLKNVFKESFIFYRPRDIVSGDFYWYENIGNHFILTCADCTGHGVPGAFMSLIGATLLNKIVEKQEVENPAVALTILDKEVSKTLRQNHDLAQRNNTDGMDLALIAINLKDKVCDYSGAYRPLYLIRNKELHVYNSNRHSIGGGLASNKKFSGEHIPLQAGDQLYLFTDGVTDQFGGEKGKKFKRERLKKLLLEFCDETMEKQHQKISEAFSKWQGNHEQIDDVLLIGIRIP